MKSITEKEFIELLNKKSEDLSSEEKEAIQKFLENIRKCTEKG